MIRATIHNRSEAEFAWQRDCEGKTWFHQPKKFALPAPWSSYTPDFYVVEDQCFYEILGSTSAPVLSRGAQGGECMTMLAQQVQVSRVENGWVLTVYHGGTTLTLVAKEIGEITGFLKGMEWQTPRPLPEVTLGAEVPQVPTALSGSYL